MHDNGKVYTLGHFKDGKQEGLATGWHENGQKAGEITYKDGTLVQQVRYKNGVKIAD